MVLPAALEGASPPRRRNLLGGIPPPPACERGQALPRAADGVSVSAPETLNEGPENRYEDSTRDEEEVLERDGPSSAGGRTVWGFLTPLGCTPENGVSGKFYIAFVGRPFLHNEKALKVGAGCIPHPQGEASEELQADSDAGFEDIFPHFSELEQTALVPAWAAHWLHLPTVTQKTTKINLLARPTETSQRRASGVDSRPLNIFYCSLSDAKLKYRRRNVTVGTEPGGEPGESRPRAGKAH